MMIYVHIPFCIKKCEYCDFLSFARKASYWVPYAAAICRELELRAKNVNSTITSIYIGGGTPSVIPAGLIGNILDTIYKVYKVSPTAEVTMECNPATVTKDSAKLLSTFPINRISIGLQSANEDELRLLGRAHTMSDFLSTYESFLKSGIDNINVDIMTGIPKQTIDSLDNTLKNVTALRPSHISTYALTLEEGTKFHSIYKKGIYPLPNEEDEFALYQEAIDYLTSQKYERYEISNFARGGRLSAHNLGYWERAPYIGVGIGAASLFNHTRYKNTTNIDRYIRLVSGAAYLSDELFEEITPLTKKDEISEYMYLGLRKIQGVSISDFESLFGDPIDAYYHKQIESLMERGLIDKAFGYLKLTPLGIDISNQVLWEFLLD